MARTLAKQFASVFEDECATFQYALSTRAGTDCVGHMFRAVTDANHRATTLCVDGIGANGPVLRASMLGRLATMPGGVPGMLPFVRLSCASPSTYSWWDDERQKRTIVQARRYLGGVARRMHDILSDNSGICQTFIFVAFSVTRDVIEHRHEYNSSCESFWVFVPSRSLDH